MELTVIPIGADDDGHALVTFAFSPTVAPVGRATAVTEEGGR